MKRWVIVIAGAAVLILLGLAFPLWGPSLLSFVGANSETIQGLDALIQILLVVGGTVLGVWGYITRRSSAKHGTRIETDGGAFVRGDVNTEAGDFVGRDKRVEARGDRSVAVGGDIRDGIVITAEQNINLIVTDTARAFLEPLMLRRPSVDLEQATQAFFHSILDRHRYLNLKGLGVSDRIPLKLPLLDLYVPLKARLEMPDGETWPRGLELAGRLIPEEDAQPLRLSEPQPLLELLQDHSGLIILGDPGSGKTTFLKFLALQAALGSGPEMELGNRLPILLPLSAYANAQEEQDIRLDDFIASYYEVIGADLPIADLLDRALESGTALILLDGLDEVKELDLRNTVAERVTDFYSFHRRKGNKFVLTSRIVGYRQVRPEAEGLAECTLVDLEDEEIEAFVTKWTRTLERQAQGETPQADSDAALERRELLAAVEGNPGVRKLAANPLLLTILALMKRQGVTLPERRVQLYDQYVTTLLSQWNRARSLSGRAVGRELDDVQTLRRLAPLALWMHLANPGAGLVKREDLRRKLEEMYRESGDEDPVRAAQGFLEDMREHAALLLERGPDEYGFIHLTFEEYLAAVAIALEAQGDPRPIAEFIGRYIGEQTWREVALLAIGYVGIRQQLQRVAGDVLEILLDTQPGSPGEAVLLAGEAVLDAGTAGVPESSRGLVTDALVPVMQSAQVEPPLRRRAGLLLGRLGWAPEDLDEFIRIPAGKFRYGDPPEKEEIAYDYWIGKYPVTNHQFARFMQAGGYDIEKYWSIDGWAWRLGRDTDLELISDSTIRGIYKRRLKSRPAEDRTRPFYWQHSEWNNPIFPVVGISCFEAEAFCRWHTTQPIPFSIPESYSTRLPTEQEWACVARGPDGRAYPWGEEFGFDKANVAEEIGKRMQTTSVKTYPQGQSPHGVWDMSGNVWEWTNSWYEKPGEFRVLRGGSWFSVPDYARCAFRGWLIPGNFRPNVGFRIVVSLADPES